MEKQYAITQVCEITLTKHEVNQMIHENLLKLGGNPSYDFARSHPIFIWNDEGGVAVRFVQGAVVAKERRHWLTLKPVPDENVIKGMVNDRVASMKRAGVLVEVPDDKTNAA